MLKKGDESVKWGLNHGMNALENVKSLTVRIFTDKEDAGAHCNIGNTKLVLDTMINWIQEINLNKKVIHLKEK